MAALGQVKSLKLKGVALTRLLPEVSGYDSNNTNPVSDHALTENLSF